MSDTKKTWIGGIIATVVNIFHKVESIADKVFKVADDFVNAVKKLQSSNIVQFLETEIEDIFPEFKGAVDAIKIWFPVAAAKIAGVEGTVHGDEAKVQAFLDHLESLKDSPTLYAGTLNTLNADLQQLIAGVQDIKGLTPQMSIAGAQVAHDETLGVAA